MHDLVHPPSALKVPKYPRGLYKYGLEDCSFSAADLATGAVEYNDTRSQI